MVKLIATVILFCTISILQTEQIAAAPTLPYGTKAETNRFYNVRTTIYGCWGDDNGIGFHGGIDLWQLKWGVAELGYRGGTTATAMGGIRGGTIATIRNPKTRRMVNVVFADVGGGHNYYQLDLHCGVAKAIGLTDTGTVQIAICDKHVTLTPDRVKRGYSILGPVRQPHTPTMQACPPTKP